MKCLINNLTKTISLCSDLNRFCDIRFRTLYDSYQKLPLCEKLLFATYEILFSDCL